MRSSNQIKTKTNTDRLVARDAIIRSSMLGGKLRRRNHAHRPCPSGGGVVGALRVAQAAKIKTSYFDMVALPRCRACAIATGCGSRTKRSSPACRSPADDGYSHRRRGGDRLPGWTKVEACASARNRRARIPDRPVTAGRFCRQSPTRTLCLAIFQTLRYWAVSSSWMINAHARRLRA